MALGWLVERAWRERGESVERAWRERGESVERAWRERGESRDGYQVGQRRSFLNNQTRASVLGSPDFRRFPALFGLARTLALPNKQSREKAGKSSRGTKDIFLTHSAARAVSGGSPVRLTRGTTSVLTNKINGFMLAAASCFRQARPCPCLCRNTPKKKLKRDLHKSGSPIELPANVGWKPAMLDANQQQ
jgi:hypothetical protein